MPLIHEPPTPADLRVVKGIPLPTNAFFWQAKKGKVVSHPAEIVVITFRLDSEPILLLRAGVEDSRSPFSRRNRNAFLQPVRGPQLQLR